VIVRDPARQSDSAAQDPRSVICDTPTSRPGRKDSCNPVDPPGVRVPITTRAQLSERLRSLSVGQRAALPYSVYAVLFPPGEPDDGARVAAFGFAREHGCVIENQPRALQVVFTKKIASPPTGDGRPR
jgi:hypothetical protein